MCMFYKNKDDKALPSRKNDMFERYTQTRHRRSLDAVTTGTASSNNTSNIDSEGEGDASDDDNEPHAKQTRRVEQQQLLTKILQWTRSIMRVRPKTMSRVTRASWCVIRSQATMTVLTCFPGWTELMMNTAIKSDDVVDDGVDDDAGTMLVTL
jgi:hypothetical protein